MDIQKVLTPKKAKKKRREKKKIQTTFSILSFRYTFIFITFLYGIFFIFIYSPSPTTAAPPKNIKAATTKNVTKEKSFRTIFRWPWAGKYKKNETTKSVLFAHRTNKKYIHSFTSTWNYPSKVGGGFIQLYVSIEGTHNNKPAKLKLLDVSIIKINWIFFCFCVRRELVDSRRLPTHSITTAHKELSCVVRKSF